MSKTILVLWFTTIGLGGCLSSEKPQINDSETVINTVGLSTEELTEELLALRESQKKLERLSELEGDLMLILNELSKQPKLDERPEGYRLERATENVEPEEYAPTSSNNELVLSNEMLSKTDIEAEDPTQATDAYSSERLAQLKNSETLDETSRPGGNYSATKSNSSPGKHGEFAFANSGPPKYILWLGFFVSEQAAHAGSQRLKNKINFQAMGLNIEVVNNANQRGQYYGLVLTPFQDLQRANSFCSALSNYGQYCKVRPSGI